MVNGPSPGPAPAAQARASSSRLTASSWRTWPQRKLRRKVPRVDAAFTRKPSTLPVPPARRAFAWSMWSPPARADITRVRTLSPTFARPGVGPRWRCSSTSVLSPRWWASVAGRMRPASGTRRSSSNVASTRSRLWDHRIDRVLLRGGSMGERNAIFPARRAPDSSSQQNAPVSGTVDPGLGSAKDGGSFSRPAAMGCCLSSEGADHKVMAPIQISPVARFTARETMVSEPGPLVLKRFATNESRPDVMVA